MVKSVTKRTRPSQGEVRAQQAKGTPGTAQDKAAGVPGEYDSEAKSPALDKRRGFLSDASGNEHEHLPPFPIACVKGK